jgi:hypothetical protein
MTTLARGYYGSAWQTMSAWQGIGFYPPAAFASAFLLCATGLLAAMISGTVVKARGDRYGAEVALFTDSFVAPRGQDLARHSTLVESKKKALDGLFSPALLGRPIIAFRIWVDDQIIYSNHREMIGRRFALSPARARAQATIGSIRGKALVQARPNVIALTAQFEVS